MSQLSIVIPVYNREKRIEKCLDSIRKQTFTDYEVILVDDGSVDSSYAVCTRYAEKDRRFKVIQKENGGVSSARNAGIRASRGQYLAFMDSDDIIPQYYYEVLCQTYKRYEEKAYVLSGIRKITQFDEDFKEGEKNFFRERKVPMKDMLKVFQEQLLNPPWNKVYDRQLLMEKQIFFDESIHIGEDLLFNLCYLEYGNFQEFVILDQNCYGYVQDQSNALTKRYCADFDCIHFRLWKKLYELAVKKGVPQEDYYMLDDFEWQICRMALLNEWGEGNSGSYWKRVGKCRQILKSDWFRKGLEKRKPYMNTGLYWAYRSGNWFLLKPVLMLGDYYWRSIHGR